MYAFAGFESLRSLGPARQRSALAQSDLPRLTDGSTPRAVGAN